MIVISKILLVVAGVYLMTALVIDFARGAKKVKPKDPNHAVNEYLPGLAILLLSLAIKIVFS